MTRVAIPAILFALLVGCVSSQDGHETMSTREIHASQRAIPKASATDLAARVRQTGKRALPEAIEALAEGLEGDPGRQTIMHAVIDAGMVTPYAYDATRRIYAEVLEKPGTRTPVGLRNASAVMNLLKTGLILRSDPRVSVDDQAPFMSNAGGQEFGPLSEASILLARVTCWPGHARGARNCFYVFKYPGPQGGDYASWTPLHQIAVAELAAKATYPKHLRDSEIDFYLREATADRYAWSVRLHALAALRRHWPDQAATVDSRSDKEDLPGETVRELVTLLIVDEPAGVRCEALALLRSHGKAQAAGAELRTWAAQAGISEHEAARIAFAARLLGPLAANSKDGS